VTAAVLVGPVQPRVRRRVGRGRLLWILGVAMVLAGMVGSVVWAMGYSPLGFERFSLDGGARSLTFDTSGEYVVYEQRVGDQPPLLTTLVVQSGTGERIVTEPPVSSDGGVVRRDLPMFAAWEVARFTVASPGIYSVYAVRATPTGPRPSGTLAVAPVSTTRWQGTWLGLAVFGALPAVIGGAVLAAAVRRDRAGSPQ
jgi:hypothetical protein